MTAVAEATRRRASPYQGLVPYSEEDADWFFGRDDWREIVVDNLRAYRLSILYGASGVGKSSLLHAGVVKALRDEARRGADDQSVRELVVTFASWSSPDPAAGLKEAIRREVEAVAAEPADASPDGTLLDVFHAWAERLDCTLLVILDQFEEYFLYHAADDRPGSFQEELSVALRRRDTPANFLLSIREDALARLDRFQGRVPDLLDNLLRLEHLDRDAAEDAVRLPLEQWSRLRSKVCAEDALVEAVLDEVGAGKVVVGAAGGRIADAPADDGRIEAPYLQLVLERLWNEEQRAGSPVLRAETLRRLGGAERIVRTHLDATMAAFPRGERGVAARAFRYLVTPSGTKIAHRAEDLAEYADVPNERLEPVLTRLAGASRILRPVGHGAYEIYHDALAEPILDWQARWQERRRYRRIAGIGLVLALVAAALAGVAAWALHQQDVANRQRDAARSRALAASANLQLESDPQRSLRLAVEAAGKSPTVEAEEALRAGLAEAQLRRVLRGHEFAVDEAAFSPDGTRIVTASDDNTARVWDAATGKVVATLRHPESVLGAAFSPDSRRIVTACEDGTARIWDGRSGKQVLVLRGHKGAVHGAAFSPPGGRVITAGEDGTARIWDAASGRLLVVLRGHEDAVNTAAFSPDDRLVATASEDGEARIWSALGGRPIAVLRADEDSIASAAFDPDGQLVVTASFDGTARIWQVPSGKTVAVLRGHTGGVVGAAFSPDGELLVTAGEDGTARIWDSDGETVAVLRGHTRSLTSASFSPDGSRVVTASYDETARVWSAPPRLALLRGRKGAFRTAAFSPDGKRIATAGVDGARIWDAAGARRVGALRGKGGPLIAAAFSPDGKRIVTTSPPRIWDATTGKSLRLLRGNNGLIYTVAFSPDGGLVAGAGRDGTARIWDAATGENFAVLRIPRAPVHGAAFSPDTKLLVTANDDATARVWDIARAKTIRVLPGHDAYVLSAVFSPDGRWIVTASGDQTARIWDAQSGRPRIVLRGHDGRVYHASFSPDGKLVVTASIDGTARIWDAATGKSLVTIRSFTGPVYDAEFSPDGRLVVGATRDKTAWIYRCVVCGSLDELVERARVQLARG